MRASVLLLASAVVIACNPPNFTPPSLVESVRILATAADKPYAAPGDAVNMQVLAFDGRHSKPEPMGIWWLPDPCINPSGDNYYACYGAFSKIYPPGVDVTANLHSGTALSFQMPADAITLHHGSRGGEPYGLAVVFTIACAGHVEYSSPPADAPADTVPFGCFDAGGTKLGPSDFVFAYSLVYSFADRANANPALQSVTYGGADVDPAAGISLPHCMQSDINRCPTTPLDVVIPDSSDETDPANLDANGNPLKEQIDVDYYLTAGKVDHDTVIIFDPHAGRLSKTSDNFHSPQSAGDFSLWAVVHDNRGGASWLQVPVHSQ
jgi:hypothetical protein